MKAIVTETLQIIGHSSCDSTEIVFDSIKAARLYLLERPKCIKADLEENTTYVVHIRYFRDRGNRVSSVQLFVYSVEGHFLRSYTFNLIKK